MGPTGESVKKRIGVSIQEAKGLFREGLARILADAEELVVVAEAEDGWQGADVPAPAEPDVILVDARRARKDGAAQIARWVKCHSFWAKVLVITATDEEESIRETLLAGAAGCLTKQSTAGDLVSAIKTVAAGEPFFSPAVSRVLVDLIRCQGREDGLFFSPAVSRVLVDGYLKTRGVASPGRFGIDTLTPRERETLKLIAEGHRSKDIAAGLGLSLKSIEVYRAHIMTKLQVRNVAGLVKLAVKKGLVTLE